VSINGNSKFIDVKIHMPRVQVISSVGAVQRTNFELEYIMVLKKIKEPVKELTLNCWF
jgi:hypothetical protein